MSTLGTARWGVRSPLDDRSTRLIGNGGDGRVFGGGGAGGKLFGRPGNPGT